MRLEPEARAVLAVLDPEPRARQLRPRRLLDQVDDALILEAVRHAPAHGKLFLRLRAEEHALGVVGLAPAAEERVRGRRDRKIEDRLDVLRRQRVLEQPIVEGLRHMVCLGKAAEERLSDRIGGERQHLCPLWL